MERKKGRRSDQIGSIDGHEGRDVEKVLLVLAHKLLDEEGEIAQHHRDDDAEKVADLFDPLPHLRHVGGFALFDVFLCAFFGRLSAIERPTTGKKRDAEGERRKPQTKREESLEGRAYGL